MKELTIKTKIARVVDVQIGPIGHPRKHSTYYKQDGETLLIAARLPVEVLVIGHPGAEEMQPTPDDPTELHVLELPRSTYRIMISLERIELDDVGYEKLGPAAEVMNHETIETVSDLVKAVSYYQDFHAILETIAHLRVWKEKD